MSRSTDTHRKWLIKNLIRMFNQKLIAPDPFSYIYNFDV